MSLLKMIDKYFKYINKLFIVFDVYAFIRVFCMSILSSIVVFHYEIHLANISGYISLLGLSTITALCVAFVCGLLHNHKIIAKSIECISILFFFLFLVVDLFLILNFGQTFNETIIFILEGTNVNESKDFIETYFNVRTIVAISIIVVLFLIIYYLIPVLLKRIPQVVLSIFVFSMIVISVGKISYAVYSTIYYGFGGHLAAYSSITRYMRYCLIYRNTAKETDKIIENLLNTDIEQSSPKCDKMVVIIGESYSKYHSQLYGYEKETSPLLKEKKDSGEIYVFNDVITPINDTERAFRAIYSLGEYFSDNYSDYLLFPYIFRQTGFYCVNIDNLDLASKTSRIKDSQKLSDVMFDKRNREKTKYDEDILDMIQDDSIKSNKNLLVIKLIGQHYTYSNTFPDTFKKFTSDDYKSNNLQPWMKQIVADYDNATLYNDYVVCSIINKFKEDNAVVIYFSDHGEEVYDKREYMGHGGTTPYLNYQIEIPFMIWMSDAYKKSNPDIVKNIQQNINKPYITDDVSHTILDMAGLKCKQFVPGRSIVNDNFNPRKSRVVMKSLIYEDIK